MPSKEAQARYYLTDKRKANTKRASEKRAALRAAARANKPPPIGRAESKRRYDSSETRRDAMLRRRYKLTQVEVDELKARAACAICGREDMKLVTDHKHEPHQVRDRLCRYCNIMVGVLEHSNFQKAVDYLAHWNSMLPD
jgi:IMP dehydrogenase/GMP reductase